jgi:predicted Rossmann fold flavoprotein
MTVVERSRDLTAPIVVVGAGAAGLVAAITAARSGRQVVLLERTADGGRKILISGGGRCNVLPAALQPERFVTGSPAHLLRALLRSWPIREQREFFERDVGIPLKLEAETQKLFPVSDRARDVRDGLVALARKTRVQLRFNTTLEDLAPIADGWRLATTAGAINAAAVVLATGGLSVPKTGSEGHGLRIASALGHVVHATYPALTPLVAAPPVHADLSGLSLRVRIRARSEQERAEAEGGFVFTHRGYSGPAVLDVSHVAVRSRLAGGPLAGVQVNWACRAADAWRAELRSAAAQARTVVARHLPQRLADRLLGEASISLARLASQLSRAELARLVDRLTAFELPWTGDEGYAKAEVTGGGVALDQVDRRTLESRRCPGLFLCGEMLDAFGPIGGHNFAWAWATGRMAGAGATRSP